LVSGTSRDVWSVTRQRGRVGDVPELLQASTDTIPGRPHMPVSVQ
jgi:hypothetical protein